MITDILTEAEFRRRIALWFLQNDRGAHLPENGSEEEFASSFALPDINFSHTQTSADKNGDIVSMLKGEIILRDWETKNGRAEKKLTVYKVLRTPASSPDSVPFTDGYIIAY